MVWLYPQWQSNGKLVRKLFKFGLFQIFGKLLSYPFLKRFQWPTPYLNLLWSTFLLLPSITCSFLPLPQIRSTLLPHTLNHFNFPTPPIDHLYSSTRTLNHSILFRLSWIRRIRLSHDLILFYPSLGSSLQSFPSLEHFYCSAPLRSGVLFYSSLGTGVLSSFSLGSYVLSYISWISILFYVPLGSGVFSYPSLGLGVLYLPLLWIKCILLFIAWIRCTLLPLSWISCTYLTLPFTRSIFLFLPWIRNALLILQNVG